MENFIFREMHVGEKLIRNRNVSLDPFNWQSFIEIGKLACSTTSRCSRGQTLNTYARR